MRALLVGAGAREHIIAEKLSRTALLYSVMPAPHPGISRLSEECLIHDPSDAAVVGEWARSRKIDVAFVSPDGLLAKGVTDTFADMGIPVASPPKKAAQIEWDKGYARNLMLSHKIPGCPGLKIAKDLGEARAALKELGMVAVKPLGLTGGKGVKIMREHLNSEEEAIAYCAALLEKDGCVLLEEKLEGEEFTLQAFCDGKSISLMPPVQDHKRAFEGDMGPNTGGMGSYSSGGLLPFMEQRDLEEAKAIMQATINAMRKEKNPFTGILYGQFMLTASGVKVIEFNARFGDPEALNVLSLLKADLAEILVSMAEGKLKTASFSNDSTVVKYLVPDGYPDSGKAGQEVSINEKEIWNRGAKAYWGSVYEKEGKIYTSTSRTAAIVAHAPSLEEAESKVEQATAFVRGPLWHRRDIGTRELLRKRMEHIRRLKK